MGLKFKSGKGEIHLAYLKKQQKDSVWLSLFMKDKDKCNVSRPLAPT
jgi:hypothetical protein